MTTEEIEIIVNSSLPSYQKSELLKALFDQKNSDVKICQKGGDLTSDQIAGREPIKENGKYYYLNGDGEKIAAEYYEDNPQKKGLAGLGDLAMLTDFGISGKAPVSENHALQITRFEKAADKGLQAGRATNQIENGKKIIKTTELTEFPKAIVNIATYCDRKFELGGEMNYFSFLKSGGSIHIKPENKGKFTETKKKTGKTTEELTHSKNPITRKRAIFAQNAKKWNHKK